MNDGFCVKGRLRCVYRYASMSLFWHVYNTVFGIVGTLLAFSVALTVVFSANTPDSVLPRLIHAIFSYILYPMSL